MCANAISQARHKKCGNIDPTKIVHELRICGKKSPIKAAVLIFGCLFFLGCCFVFSTSCEKNSRNPRFFQLNFLDWGNHDFCLAEKLHSMYMEAGFMNLGGKLLDL